MNCLLETAAASSVLMHSLTMTFPVNLAMIPAMVAAISVKGLKGGGLKFGDKCKETAECDFEGSICDSVLKLCQCIPELPVTNHLDKCGKAASVNDSCSFNEQCEQTVFQTECRDGRCLCRFDKIPVATKDGIVECQNIPKEPRENPYRVDPTMIGILAGMFLMFIILCVVLRLFSKARWRENRTIFNTPNPRLMNASLLQHNKSIHEGRRGSRASARGPSRTGSVNSLRPHSPSASLGSRNGASRSRCNSRDESFPDMKSPTRKDKGEFDGVRDESFSLEQRA
ncbi:hypothetical protein RUM44_005187 [Polyplax serrata]|uniref:EB domain-containing protein n=1 Tax=Polyplax serrata TaxID=468196 RepID=A0ABR1AEC1_POLSC